MHMLTPFLDGQSWKQNLQSFPVHRELYAHRLFYIHDVLFVNSAAVLYKFIAVIHRENPGKQLLSLF
ncbi:hypothetical protein D3H55_00350 [Bacillus salacetis]|uniref:Uncharacterized protein n=1 Tax=Bacillus salacetis TaxID=2315464 RepID=A0A3A1RBP7_9BACI|nr:hypothetical protein D3H55_00350 [Bacillus salacetis]